jgi:hypothetical protein
MSSSIQIVGANFVGFYLLVYTSIVRRVPLRGFFQPTPVSSDGFERIPPGQHLGMPVGNMHTVIWAGRSTFNCHSYHLAQFCETSSDILSRTSLEVAEVEDTFLRPLHWWIWW